MAAMREIMVEACDLYLGDVFYFNNGWVTVLHSYCHPNSCYNKLNVSQPDSTIPLAIKLSKNLKVRMQSRETILVLKVQNALEQSKVVTNRLDQLYSIMEYEADADGKVSLGTSLKVDKNVLVKTARADLTAEASKLAELIKKM